MFNGCRDARQVVGGEKGLITVSRCKIESIQCDIIILQQCNAPEGLG